MVGVDVFGKWFFDRYSLIINIKVVGNVDVIYGLVIDGDKVICKEFIIEVIVIMLCFCLKEISEYLVYN